MLHKSGWKVTAESKGGPAGLGAWVSDRRVAGRGWNWGGGVRQTQRSAVHCGSQAQQGDPEWTFAKGAVEVRT